MKKKSSNLSRLKRALWHRSQDDKDSEYRRDYRMLHGMAQDSEEEVEKMFDEAEMWSIRNPAFPDDFVGYPEDDRKFFDEIEEEKKKKKDEDETE